MSTNSAAGSDGMSASLFKECGDKLCIPLQIFFAKSLTEGTGVALNFFFH